MKAYGVFDAGMILLTIFFNSQKLYSWWLLSELYSTCNGSVQTKHVSFSFWKVVEEGHLAETLDFNDTILLHMIKSYLG